MKLLTILAIAAITTTVAHGQQIQISQQNKTIAISTSDDASALADTAVVTVGFSVFGKDQDETYANATKTSNAIFSSLTSAGVPKEAITSSEQRLSPIEPNSEEDMTRYAEGLRFSFAQSWQVTVPASQAASVLHVAVINGANNSGDIQWQLKHDDTLQAEAAQKALQHAREIANRMAQGLGAKLGALVYASNQAPPRDRFIGGLESMNTETVTVSAQKARNLAPLAITPDRITKSATVYAVFAIE